MGETKKKVSLIHYIVVAAFCLLFRFVPPAFGLTELGMGIVGTFIGAVYGWIMIDMLWPSIMALLGVGLVLGMPKMLAASFGNETIVCLILAMGAVGIATKNGAFAWLASALLNNKFMEGKAYLAIFVIFVAAWLCGSFNPIIMCVIFCSFLTAMFKQVGVKKDDPLIIFTFLGVAYQLMRGQILFPFVGTGLVYLNSYRAMFPDLPMPVTDYLIMMGIMGILMAVVFIALMKFVFRVDASPLANYKQQSGGVPKCKRDQKIALVMFVVFITLNILANVGPLKGFLHQFVQ